MSWSRLFQSFVSAVVPVVSGCVVTFFVVMDVVDWVVPVVVVGVVPVVVVTDVSEVFSAVDPYVTVWVIACWVVAGIVE